MGSGSFEVQPEGHLVTESDTAFLRKFVCWRCGNLGYCPHCKKFECRLGLPLTIHRCRFRKDVEGVIEGNEKDA